MTRPKYLGILLVALTATGCATNAHRTTDSVMTRSGPFSKAVVPKQTQVAMPPEAPDIFQAAQATNQRGLARYFPGLARKGGENPPARALSHPGHDSSSEPTVAAVVPTPPTRSSLFSMLKPRAPQSYSTDLRPTIAARSNVEPSILPVALRLPAAQADNAVTPTSANVADDSQPTDSKPIDHDPTSAKSAASDTATSPVSTTEPQLAIGPIPPPQESNSPGVDPAPEPAAIPADESKPQASPDVPAVDPRERPRLSADFTPSPPIPDSNPEPVGPKVAATVAAAQPTESAPRSEPTPEPTASSSAPSVADPNHSLGLPSATLPSSYYQHNSVAVRGSHQATQPPPVLASPQYAASPQSAGSNQASGHKSKQRPSLMRFVRKMSGMQEPATQ